jgi:hypothetical protein
MIETASPSVQATRAAAAVSASDVEGRAGEAISLTLGPEVYSPVKYNTFTIGPFSATVVIQPGETTADAVTRCYRVLAELNEVEFNLAWDRHKSRLAKMPRQGND